MEYLKKVYIKSEADLPKTIGFHFISYKPLPRGSCPLELEYFDMTDERKDYWLEKIDWYLLPVESPMLTDEMKVTDEEIEEWAKQIIKNTYNNPLSEVNRMVEAGINFGAKASRDGKIKNFKKK